MSKVAALAIVRDGCLQCTANCLSSNLAGGIVKVGAYDTELWATPAQARRAFFKGRCVLILEPFFKRGLDGLCFIRVDQRDDIIVDIPDPRPETAAAWHLQGNAFYTASPRSDCSPLAAIDCWSRALMLAGDQVAVLLANRAAAELAAAMPALAAADAAVASVLDPTNPKAAFRLITALVDMTEHTPLDGRGLAALEAVKKLPSCWWEAPNLINQVFKRPALSPPTYDASWEQHKEKGNTAFRAGNFAEAVDSYTQSLSALYASSKTPSLAKLLCNRAIALTQAGKIPQALMDATCAVALQPLNVKAWHHRASALQKLGQVEASQASCNFGREAAVASGERRSLPAFASIETKLVAMGNPDATAPKKSTAEHAAEREAHTSMFKAKSYAAADEVGLLNMMTEMMPPDKQRKMFGRKIEPMFDFRFELGKYGGGFPTGVDAACANDYLRQSYEHARSLPHTMEMHLRQTHWEPDEHDILKRLNSPWRLEWYLGDGQRGDFCPELPAEGSTYASYVRHSFSNQAYRKEVLQGGKTHVAVGFVDLGLLLAADIRNSDAGPVRFIGYELSAYSIAKTLVLWDMLCSSASSAAEENDQVRSILQVWYSASWAAKTMQAFSRAIASLCTRLAEWDEPVRHLIKHWGASNGVALSRGRKLWMNATSDARSTLGGFLLRQDRIDMARYELTGDFGLVSEPACGSVTMFDCPDGTPPLDKDESVFSTLHCKDLVPEGMQPDGAILANPGELLKVSLMTAAEEKVMSDLKILRERATKGAVKVELRMQAVQDSVREIAAERPWTMSWSNVLDYFNAERFHAIARESSAFGDTIHFGYSMNWSCGVRGTNIMDFCGPQFKKTRNEVIDMANESLSGMYHALGWQHRLRLPPPENPYNTTGFSLECVLWKKWAAHWINFAGSQCSLANVEHAMPSPLSCTGGSTVSMTWTYDPQISFSPANKTLTPEQEHELEKTIGRTTKEGMKASRSKK